MNKKAIFYACIATFSFVGISEVFAKESSLEPKVVGSLSTNGVKPSNFPKLAKISASEATKIAVAQESGNVLSVGLENEDGFLIYAVQVANEKSGYHEVIIDAGNGKVISSSAKKSIDELDNDNEHED